ncbi:MAG TPA: hypothetical protein VK997_14570 [Deferrisomatales bacterium]|nr:hypothetical protein [Deferrisomatales bacterium]
MEAGVGRAAQQFLQGQQTPRLADLFLAVDLLQAQHVGIQAQQHGPHHRDAFLQGGPLPRFVVQVLQVESGHAQAGVPEGSSG